MNASDAQRVSLLSWDNQRLVEYTREAGCRDKPALRTPTSRQRVVACRPDAIAWCWAKGGDRRRIEPVVAAVRSV
jgi:hypothetical protein